jgi:hypothetical protein
MTSLSAEFDRLFALSPGSLVDAQGQTRALVLEVVQPAGWDVLAPVWQAVQAELDLPAPAIAVSGTDGLQLWFSLEAAVDATQGHAFLDALRQRLLPELSPARLRLLPDPAQPGRHAAPVPALQVNCTDWSAFVASDLAVMFSDTPWLDIEPNADGQAALLRPLRPIKPAELDAALARLRAPASRASAPAGASAGASAGALAGASANAPALAPEPAPQAPVLDAMSATAAVHDDESTHPHIAPEITAAVLAATREDDPRRFLLRVMNDERVDMALRIEAAKALLPR